ncbi:MAG: hypothetical protein FWD89_00475 [Firmicutes bacterium]|nr:hypothetical protein [Bacillota bacterium]MCL2770774.1 hypothetical protein [Bacillota bacterium]
MIKLWVKLHKGERLVKNIIHKFELEDGTDYINADDFYKQIQKICEGLDIATPVVLSAHFNNFQLFNFCEFKKTDFVDEFKFTKMVVSIARE